MTRLPFRISEEQVRIHALFRTNSGFWFTVADVAFRTGVSDAATKKHVRTLLSVGLIEVNDSLIASMYRWNSVTPSGDAATFLERLERAEKGYATLREQERLLDEGRRAA